MQHKTNKPSFQVILIALVFIFAIIIFGVIGYVIIEDLSIIDALYMTIITISTVGYGEVHALSPSGKIFTIFLIVTSLGTFTYTISILASYFIDGQIGAILGRYKKRHTKHMKDHIIIVGYGRNGKQTAIEAIAHHNKCIIIEIN